MKYNKNEVITKTKEYIERMQDYLTEICRICVFIRLRDAENQNNPITRDVEFISALNRTVDDCKTALENLNNLSKSPNQFISVDNMADAVAPIGHMQIEIDHMYCDLDAEDFDMQYRRKCERIQQNFNMIFIIADDMEDFLYEVYPDA